MQPGTYELLRRLAKRRHCTLTALIREGIALVFRHYREDLE